MVERTGLYKRNNFLSRCYKIFVSIYLGERSPTFIATLIISLCKLLSWFLTDYCILRSISQNEVTLWVTLFCEIFRKNTICHFYSHSIDYSPDQIAILKTCRIEILNVSSLVTPCFTNSYFSGQYFNYKIILESLNKYYGAKIPYKSPFS